MTNPELDQVVEGINLLAAVDPELLPLIVERGLLGNYLVVDRNGLEFAVPGGSDKATAELIAWLINNGMDVFSQAVNYHRIQKEHQGQLAAIDQKQQRDARFIADLEARLARYE